jgi:hypothetical protein
MSTTLTTDLQRPEETWESVLTLPPEPVDAPAPLPGNDHTLFGLIELLLKAPGRVNDLVRLPDRQPEFIQRFMAIALVSFGLFGLGIAILVANAPPSALPGFMAEHQRVHPRASAIALCVAYTIGLTLATGVCLPSFYFYTLLAGIRVSVLQVTAQIMKGKSATCLMLMGILPIYIAIVLGALVFKVDVETLRWAIWLGLVLPFVAGGWGLTSIYNGFVSLGDTIDECRRADRLCYLRRLTLACTANYAAVAPVMIYTLWKYIVVACG